MFSQQVIGAPFQHACTIPNGLDAGHWTGKLSCPQPLCCDSEGWGPLNPTRDGLTPCFVDLLALLVAVFGISIVAPTVRLLVKERTGKEGATKDCKYWTRMACIACLISAAIVQTVGRIGIYRQIWFADLGSWAHVLLVAVLSALLVVEYLESETEPGKVNKLIAFYWPLLALILGAKVQSAVSDCTNKDHIVYFIALCTGFGLSCVESVLVWLVRKRSAYRPLPNHNDDCPSERASLFSTLTFSWMTPMMAFGYKHRVTEDDLPELAKSDTTGASANAFGSAWRAELDRRKEPSIWRALFHGFGRAYVQALLFKAGADIFSLLQPQLLRSLMSFVGSRQGNLSNGIAIASAMFLVSVAQSLCLHQCFQRLSYTGIKVKSALLSTVYAKSLKLSNGARAAKSTGDIVNLMALDTQRLQDAIQFSQHLWSAPLQMILCVASLYQLLGLSMLAGVAVMILMIPINRFLTRAIKTLQKQQMQNKDARSNLIAEVIKMMKSLKLLAWGSAFMDKIGHIRNDRELATLRKIGTLQALSGFTGAVAPFLIACAAFTTYVLTSSNPLTTEIVFPAFVLFHLLTSPLTVLPAAISSLTEAGLAANRLGAFVTADEAREDAVSHRDAIMEAGAESVAIRDATFSWDRHETGKAIEHVNFVARTGELCCLVGRIGAGKSALIQAILGDLHRVNGTVTVCGSVAYVAQDTWLLNATVRDNITFGHEWDPEFYEATVTACALLDDFAQLPNGDQTEVGDRGILLSGGQKARLSLARAIYSRADIYLLDDPLAAVDQHVARHLVNNVLGRRGLLNRRTRIVATNSQAALAEADSVVLVQSGRVAEQGGGAQIMAMKGGLGSFVGKLGGSSESDKTAAPEAGSNTARQADIAGCPSFHRKPIDVCTASNVRTERSQRGRVKWEVYGDYAKANNRLFVALYAVALIGSQAAEIGSSMWLKHWEETHSDVGDNPRIGSFIGIYIAFGLGSAGLVLIQNVVLWLVCSIEASRTLHERMTVAIFRSPMSFFEGTPAGQILNRFSSDIYRIDESLPRQFNALFVNMAKAIFILGVITLGTPPFAVFIVPLGVFYIYMQRYYLGAKRDLKRLDSISRSPVFAHFQESLGGVATIRAYGAQERFTRENERRVDANMKAYIPSVTANRWLGVRLEFIGSFVVLLAAGFAVTSVAYDSRLSAGMVGLTISYALQITQSLGSLVRATGEVETNIVSVERVLEYTDLPSEAPEVIQSHRPPTSWPAQGAVRFVDYSIRYRPGLDLALRNINLDITAKEKIGVVGRTGAGKSTLALSLFRIIEPSQGRIDIDGLNTSSMGLLDLRQRLAIIPQDAALFEGTVRENMDPEQAHDDTELWAALELSQLKEHVATMCGGLDAKIYEGGMALQHRLSHNAHLIPTLTLDTTGSNLSQGQKQLMSLARALLRPTSILVLDEATAAVDIETDTIVQKILRQNLSGHKTVITIAHRINTVIDSDRVVVLDKGEVIEFDTPAALLAQKGAFYLLAKEAGLLEES
ncbi:ABC transporter [Tolypocladium paradoxum]|uniref:ABC transporter n=1 Tax=Tolypocladium paradoxum TaxID=94208 RepID=A0A2S4L566_9HYPO|nr:ABC transporter [Tolypocladium paradoxum]